MPEEGTPVRRHSPSDIFGPSGFLTLAVFEVSVPRFVPVRDRKESSGMKAVSEAMTSQKAWGLMRDEYLPKREWRVAQSWKKWENELDEFNEKSHGRADEQYLLDLADLKMNQTEKLARSLLMAGCEVWKKQGREESQGFFQAIWENSLLPLFRSRRQHVIRSLERKRVLGLTDETVNSAVARVGGWLAGQMTQFRLRIEAGDSNFPEQPEVAQKHLISLYQKSARNPGPTPMWGPEAAEFAGQVWRRRQSKTGRVSAADLRAIACELDEEGYLPPAKYLYKEARDALNDFNTKHGHAREGSIQTWKALVKQGNETIVKGMKRVLSDCANKHPK